MMYLNFDLWSALRKSTAVAGTTTGLLPDYCITGVEIRTILKVFHLELYDKIS